jgi:formyl-CoA transferase
MRALDGIRILDFSRVLAGPYCTMLLADLGADVIKVEAPGVGDLSRGMAPRLDDETSGAFLTVNRNKRSIALDLKSDEGIAVAKRLVGSADVVIENFRPGVMAKFGLDYESLREDFPGLVYCSISGFGQTGPYAQRGGLDLIAQGMTGLMSITGEPDRPPVKCGIPVTDLGAGLFAVYGILAALYERKDSGVGQYVETSLYEAGLGLQVWEVTEAVYTGRVPQPTGSAHRLGAPYQAYRCADGAITVGADSSRHWAAFCSVVGLDNLTSDPRFSTNASRMVNLHELQTIVEEQLAPYDRAHWLKEFEDAGIPAGPINSVPEAIEDPHTAARAMILEQEHPDFGTVRTLGPVVKLSRTAATVRTVAPRIGADSAQVLEDCGFTTDEVNALLKAGTVRDAAPAGDAP